MASSMKNLPLILALIYFSFINHDLITMMTIVASKPIYEPKENLPINCGSPDELPAQDHRTWIADPDKDARYSLIESGGSQSKSSAFNASPPSTVEPVPYMTARVSRSQFTYSFRLSPGPKFIRLHFHPTQYIGLDDFDPSKAYFAVEAGRFTLLRNFSAYLNAESSGDKTVMKEFCVYVEENVEKLDITFIPYPSPPSENHSNGTSYAFVNGIEIVSMPDTLYYTAAGDQSPHLIGQNYIFQDYTDKALQTVHRLNVGGGYIPPDRDTGMYREWKPDFPDYFISQGFVPCKTSQVLRYTKIANYTAPDDVYRTATTMGNNATKNNLRNITWKLPVDSGFKYLVRLHFCEFQELYTKPEDRMFRIYLDNHTAENAFSVIVWSGGNSIPIYKDYVVNILDEAYLFVDLHTRAEDSTHEDAILNGMEVFKLSNNSDGNLAGPNPPVLPSPVPPPPSNPNIKSKNTLMAIALGSGVAGFVVLLSMVCCVVWLRLRKEKRHHSSYKRKSNRSTLLASSGSLPEQLCHCFSLSEIKMATNNFDPGLVIGRGGFGYVYKGQLTDEASSVVAIKRLNKGLSGQGEREFEAEIKMLSQLRHVHLVSLIGYCDEDDEMILVYDYMANGTLRDHLYGTENEPLPWKQRLEICVGAAKGLHYLHSEVKNTVIHRDVKTTNILLDEKWEAKVADFGLSKLGRGDSAAVSTAVKGTFGYMDPEYAQSRQLTDKSDVYSFGVVLFEVLCARKPVDVKLEEDQRNLAQWARKSVRGGKIHNIIDPYLIGKIAPECFKKFVEVAERCVRDYTNQRPTMREVMEMLEFALELQEQADSVKQRENPGGVCSYPEHLSFLLADDNRGAGYDVLGLRSGASNFTNTMDSKSAGLSLSTLDSDSGTREIFSDATDSKLSQK